MRILVTGGAGFIGGHLVESLVHRKHEVVVLDTMERQVHGDTHVTQLPPEVSLVKGSVNSAAALRQVLTGVEAVYHFAAQVGVGQSMYDIPRYVDANIGGTGTLLQGMIDSGVGVKKLIVAASMSSYGEGAYRCPDCGIVYPPLRSVEQLHSGDWEVSCPDCGKSVTPIATPEDKPLNCNSVYALTKRVQEDLCMMLGRTYGIRVVSVRFFNAYGPRQSLNNPYTGVCAIFQSRIKNGVAPVLFEDGRQTRDFVSVRDIVDACVKLIGTSAADFEALNIGSGQPTTIESVAKTLSELYGVRIPPSISGNYRKGDVRHCFADISKARRMIGFEPSVSLKDGLSNLVDWSRTVTAADRFGSAFDELVAHGLVEETSRSRASR